MSLAAIRSCYICPITTYIDGAALFYTTPIPQTLQIFRQYALHLLFTPPAPSPGLTSETAAPVRNPFPFLHKANTLDRDRIVVPAGWDSWGKIAVLRDGFDAKAWGEAWENDLDQIEGEPEQSSAKRQYSRLIPDQGLKVSGVCLQILLPLADACCAAHAAATLQQPHARAGFPRKELRRELEESRSRSACIFPESHREPFRRRRRPDGKQQLRTAERRTRTH